MSRERLASVGDMAAKLSCSPETVRRMLRTGEIPGIKVGADWRVDPRAVELALSRNGTSGDGPRKQA
jgi:excisionase family DNA binding protein